MTGVVTISDDVVRSLEKNGTYLPDVERVSFKLVTEDRIPKTDKDGKPVLGEDGKPAYDVRPLGRTALRTKVWWADGTTTTVRSSKHDLVETEEVEMEDGSKVTVATECSKTFGVMAAVVKRTCGVPGEDGEMVDTGVGRILTEIVEDGYDKAVEDAKARIRKAKSAEAKKKAAEAKAQPKKPRAKRWSANELLQLAGPILEALAKRVAENPSIVESILGADKAAELKIPDPGCEAAED